MQLKNMNTLHIQIACGGIEPRFLKEEFCSLQYKLPGKKSKHPKSKSPRKYLKLGLTCSWTYVLLMRCEVHKSIYAISSTTSQQLKSIPMRQKKSKATLYLKVLARNKKAKNHKLDGLPNHDQPVIVKKMPTSSIKS